MGKCQSKDKQINYDPATGGDPSLQESQEAQREANLSLCECCFEKSQEGLDPEMVTLLGVVLQKIEDLRERHNFWDAVRDDAYTMLRLVEWTSSPFRFKREFVSRISFLYRKDYDDTDINNEPIRAKGGLATGERVISHL